MLRGRLRSFVATVGLLAWVAGLALPVLGGQHVPDFADVGETFLGVLHPVTQVEPIHPSLSDDHCAICHLQRAARGAALTASGVLTAVASAPSDPVADHLARASASLVATPPRGPPLASTSTIV